MVIEADYESIRKKMHELHELCLKNNVPMMAVIGREDEEKGTVYEREIITPRQVGVTLSDDRFSKLNVAFTKGFYIRFKNNTIDQLGMGELIETMIDIDEIDEEEYVQMPVKKPGRGRPRKQVESSVSS